MMGLLWVALGGAVGASARYGVSLWLKTSHPPDWPLATLGVNVMGSVLIGLLYVLLERNLVSPDVRQWAMIGFLGAFTTFSTFSLELLRFLEGGHWPQALAYGVASVATCLLGVWAGVAMMRLFT